MSHPASSYHRLSTIDLLTRINGLVALLHQNNIDVPDALLTSQHQPVRLEDLPGEILIQIMTAFASSGWKDRFGEKQDLLSLQMLDFQYILVPAKASPRLFDAAYKAINRKISAMGTFNLHDPRNRLAWNTHTPAGMDASISSWVDEVFAPARRRLQSLELRIQLGGNVGHVFSLSEHRALVREGEALIRRLPVIFPRLRNIRIKFLVPPRVGASEAIRLHVDMGEIKTPTEASLELDLAQLVQAVRELQLDPLEKREVTLGEFLAHKNVVNCCTEIKGEAEQDRLRRILNDGESAGIARRMTNLWWIPGRAFSV